MWRAGAWSADRPRRSALPPRPSRLLRRRVSALLVANHAFGWNVAFAMALIERRTGRRVWALGEHAWWSVPFVRGAAAVVGVVDGTPENVDRLLSRDELVLVLTGGLRAALKPRELRYRLLCGRRYGFVRAAIRNQTPMVPLASLGADEWFDWVGAPLPARPNVAQAARDPHPFALTVDGHSADAHGAS